MRGADDADPDDAGLEGLRSMWRSLPDEEPPAGGLASLMAAARVKAEEMAQPSLWERFVAMMRRPQVLALATIMILIGGAVFISQRRDTLEATQSTSAGNEDRLESAREQAPAAQPTPAAATTSSAEQADGRARGGGGASAGSAATVGGAAYTVEKRDDKSAPDPMPAPQAVAPPQKAITKKLAPGGTKAPMKPKSEQQTKSGMAGGSTSSALSIDELGDAGKATEESKPVAPADDAPTVKQLHAQARAAAARNDCAAVKSLAKKIAAKDAPYYRSNIAPDTALAACLN